jgi:hypothetical protein
MLQEQNLAMVNLSVSIFASSCLRTVVRVDCLLQNRIYRSWHTLDANFSTMQEVRRSQSAVLLV